MNLTATPRGRRVLFTAYYALEGAPIGFLWWALPSIAASEGVGSERIGVLLGWLVLPWALKWLWAPFVDAWQGPHFGLRGWIVAAQAAMAASLLPLVGGASVLGSDLLLVCLGLHAVAASTQDAAIDALVIHTTEPLERARLAAWMQVGMLGGRSLLGGGALLMLGTIGSAGVVGTLLTVVIAGLGLALLYRSPPPIDNAPPPAVASTLRAVLSRRRTWLGVLFGATAGAGFEAVGAFAGPLLTERSGDTELAGSFFLAPAVIAMALGGLAAGRLADRAGARQATRVASLLLALCLLALSLAIARASMTVVLAALTAVYAAIGAFTATSYALFMGWTEPRFASTQYSAFMGATNLCEAWAAFVAGALLIPALGYAGAFALLALVGLLGALAILGTRGRTDRGDVPAR
jgi:MFS transporter, PAT family, beta-lactamase induction signal transducer AmpG